MNWVTIYNDERSVKVNLLRQVPNEGHEILIMGRVACLMKKIELLFVIASINVTLCPFEDFE